MCSQPHRYHYVWVWVEVGKYEHGGSAVFHPHLEAGALPRDGEGAHKKLRPAA